MAAGFSEKGLQLGAEVNASVGPHGTNTGGNRVGRQIGIDLYKHYKPGQLTPDDIDKEIKAALPQMKKFPEYQPFPGPATAPTWPGQRLSGPWDLP